MTDYREMCKEAFDGDVVIKQKTMLDTEKVPDNFFTSPWNKKRYLVGYVCDTEHGELFVKPVEENDISDEEWSGNIGHCRREEEAEIGMFCIECDSKKIYHDGKEEWVCPHCEI